MSEVDEIVYDWSGHGRDREKQENEILGDLESATILVNEYDYVNYEGYAFVLFEKNGTLYECNGSHCSCYGLGGQWYPEETSWDALRMRKFRYLPGVADQIAELIEESE